VSGRGQEIEGQASRQSKRFLYKNRQLPIYGCHQTFTAGSGLLIEAESQRSALQFSDTEDSRHVRIGYDLFAEIDALLRQGQPLANAHFPALDLHIALLRELIVTLTGWLVEIPPVPHGAQFIACLTHDVDHPSLRLHRFDHTTAGFLSRALFGSLGSLVKGRISFSAALRNWFAAASLPLVQLGLLPDPWEKCVDYARLEQAPSTFFFIPFAGKPGQRNDGHSAPEFRASRYGIADVVPLVHRLLASGREVALHGIDAWRDTGSARSECEEIRKATESNTAEEVGVRMHWLYYSAESPAVLESAGITYDSTVGYNETFGYRSGTNQVYRQAGAEKLLELPLHLMDTALFYPAYLDLSESEAKKKAEPLFEHATQAGGVITINWHDRSIAPERQWGGFYLHLLQRSRELGAWLASASDTVAWFRMRRAARFVRSTENPDEVAVTWSSTSSKAGLPPLRLRTYRETEIQDVTIDVAQTISVQSPDAGPARLARSR
jgi:hypothetical protein